VFASFSNLARNHGLAAVIATHNMQLARYMDRVLAIKDGHLEEARLG
jgi:lipoprotein-releasing system ATP-binding protein